MRFLHVLAIAGFAFAGSVEAQSTHGYVFFAPGGATSGGYTAMTLNLGFGGEARLASHIGGGAEIGTLGFRSDFSDSVLGVFSPNAYLHLSGARNPKIDPYVTAGYTLLFRSGHASLFNFGG